MPLHMKLFDHPLSRKIKHWLGWIIRPRLTFLRIREQRHARNAPPVRNNLNVSDLPIVVLRLAETPEDFSLVLDLYRRNPSGMTISPRTAQAMQRMLADNTEFYRIFDDKGVCVGNIAFQINRNMLGYLTIEYGRRGEGLALAARLAMYELLVKRGIQVVYSQIYRDNRRTLSGSLSLGWEIIEEQSTDRYFTLKKVLIPPRS